MFRLDRQSVKNTNRTIDLGGKTVWLSLVVKISIPCWFFMDNTPFATRQSWIETYQPKLLGRSYPSARTTSIGHWFVKDHDARLETNQTLASQPALRPLPP